MYKLLNCLVLFAFLLNCPNLAAQQKTEIMIVGFDHLSQLSNGTPESNIFSNKKQAELVKLAESLKKFAPDIIMIEREPSQQKRLDSLFNLYKSNKLDLKDIEDGSSEAYQTGFRLAKMLNLTLVYGIDYYESVSQGMLSNGDNIDIFRNGLKGLQQIAKPLRDKVQQDNLSLYDYIAYMNKPETLQLTHRLFFNSPAYVVNGSFSESAINTAKTGPIDEAYIGAEYISIFYRRNLKIYSNVLNTQMATSKKRALLIMGQCMPGFCWSYSATMKIML